MKKNGSNSKLTAQPPNFPPLTKAQRAWVAARRGELKAAIDAGLESGDKDGYLTFDVDRILAFIEQRRRAKPLKRVKRG